MKYKTVKEIISDETLDLCEMMEMIEQFLKAKGMTVDEFLYETEEGQRLQEESADARFTMPMSFSTISGK